MEQHLIFMSLHKDDEEVYVRIDAIQHIRAMDRGGSFVGLDNGQYETVDETPREVLEEMARMFSEVIS